MAWTSPRTWSVGELVTAALMNTHVRDNLIYLKDKVDIAFKLVGRQGGSATNWETQGTTNFTPTSVKVQSGVVRVATINTASGALYYGSVQITFPEAFTYRPIVIASLFTANTTKQMTVSATDNSTTQATVYILSDSTASNYDVAWLAIGE